MSLKFLLPVIERHMGSNPSAVESVFFSTEIFSNSLNRKIFKFFEYLKSKHKFYIRQINFLLNVFPYVTYFLWIMEFFKIWIVFFKIKMKNTRFIRNYVRQNMQILLIRTILQIYVLQFKLVDLYAGKQFCTIAFFRISYNFTKKWNLDIDFFQVSTYFFFRFFHKVFSKTRKMLLFWQFLSVYWGILTQLQMMKMTHGRLWWKYKIFVT